MALAGASIQERRRFPRTARPGSLAINLLEPYAAKNVPHVNTSEGGLCLRLPGALEMRSLVRLQVGAGPADGRKRTELVGRVAWVMQRLDLRARPPFPYDVGIEFLQPAHLARLATVPGGRGERVPRLARDLEPAMLRGRTYAPEVTREGSARWHLIVTVESVPCFSGHYASERAARGAWAKFKRTQGRR